MTDVPEELDELHLLPLPEQLRRRDPPVPADVLGLDQGQHVGRYRRIEAAQLVGQRQQVQPVVLLRHRRQPRR